MGVLRRHKRRRGPRSVSIVAPSQFCARLLDAAAVTGPHKLSVTTLGTNSRIGLKKKFDGSRWKHLRADIAPFGHDRTRVSDLSLNRQQPGPYRRNGGYD